MDAVHVGVPFVETTLAALEHLGSTRVFVMANRSSSVLAEPLVTSLGDAGLLAAPLCLDIGMGGGEEGLLKACDAAAAAGTDVVVSIGGGAIHDAGKLLRLWLSQAALGPPGTASSIEGIQAATRVDGLKLAPQIAAPNSFAMAELTSVAGVTTRDNVKSGAAHAAMMPTVVVYDPALSKGLPDWVRFGTALRGVEHAIGAVCHPKATDEHREAALDGLRLVARALRAMIATPEDADANIDAYRGGWITIRALNAAGYPAVAHFVQNHYSARFGVHQGSCSGVLSARILHQHHAASAAAQARLSEALGAPGVPASQLVRDLVAGLPGVAKDHADAKVDTAALTDFAEWFFATHATKLNTLSPVPYAGPADVLSMLTRPLAEL